MKAAPLQTSFNGGELSPLIAGRVDVAKYASGCERLENFIPTIQGPAVSRPGFRFVAEVKQSTNRTWLMRFEFSAEEAFQIEFGDRYLRFYTSRGQVQVSGVSAYSGATAYVVGDLVSDAGVNYYCKAGVTGTAPPNATYWHALTGTIYEIPSPYLVADLTNDDGTFALRYAQTGDVIRLAHEAYPPMTLTRFSGTRWTLAKIAFASPAFDDRNDTATTVYASAATGAVTLNASAAVFTAAMVGEAFYLAEKDVRSTKLWEAGKPITTGDLRRSDGKNYQALNTATTGGGKPTHSSGAVFDGDTGVQWQFLDPGYGYATITGYTSATQVSATVVSRLPDNAVGAGNPTTRWAKQAWSAATGYPSCVTFFRERAVWARGDTLWFSVSADFDNFAYEIDGEITPDAGFSRTIASDRSNSIRWLSPGKTLLVGTLGDEWAIKEATIAEAFGPANCETGRQSTYGASRVQPQRIGTDTLFVQKAGRKVRAMAFKFEDDGFESPDVTVFSEHVTASGITDIAYQQEPHSIVWACRSDGVLIGCTYSREQDVVAWHRHPMTGAIVECVESIPSPDGERDDLWIIARYTINGATRRYIGYLADVTQVQADWVYSDMAATYSGPPTTTITGLDYLEGQEVWVLCDGALHPNRTVSSGAITLQLAGSKVQVGLPAAGWLETMNLEGGSGNGTAQGKTKRAHYATVRVLDSLGGMAGPDEDHMQEMRYRTPSVPMGSAPAAFTGDLPIEWDGDYSTRATVVVKKDRPMPLTVVAVMPQLVVSEGR